MTDLKIVATGSRALADRLFEGGMPVDEALHYATLLGETLRNLHSSGKAHGAVSPETILLTDEGIELMPARGQHEDVADAMQADIFAFGAVLREMLNSPKILSDAKPLQNATVDRLIASCLSADPATRMPSIQKALLELKLATLSTRHAGASTVRWRDLDSAMRAEIQESEARVEAWLEARIVEHERNIAQRHQAASEALTALRVEFIALGAKLTIGQQSAEKNVERMNALESAFNSVSQQNAALEARLGNEIRKIEKDIEAQAAVIDTVRASTAQTDDLVGRVVEAVEVKLAHAQETVEDTEARLEAVERSITAASQQNATLEATFSSDIQKVRKDIESQNAIVETVRASMAQTDDLVGRVVEAVEAVLDLGSVLS